MREAMFGKSSRLAILWVAWIGLALALAGCGDSGGGSASATTSGNNNQNAQNNTARPVITGVSPTEAQGGSFIEIQGSNFGSAQFSTSQVLFIRTNGETLAADPVTNLSDWSNTRIRVLLLGSLSAETIKIQVKLRGGSALGGSESNQVDFTVLPAQAPQITSVMPTNAVAGQAVTIEGTNFGDAQFGSSGVFFTGEGGTLVSAGRALSWTNSRIVVALPQGARSGPVIVSKGSLQSTPSTGTLSDDLIIADNTPPTVISASPANLATGVDPRVVIQIQFSETMNSGTLDVQNWGLTSSTGGLRAISRVEQLSPSTFRFTPSSNLDGGVLWRFQLLVGGGTTRVGDLAGNSLLGVDLAFTTSNIPGIPGSDVTPPTLTSVSPSNRATNQSIDTAIQLTFSEPVSLSASAVRITSAGGDVSGTITVSPMSGFASFFVVDPPRLVGGVTYTVTVNNTVQDQAGNAFAGATFTFTTQEVPGLPGSDQTPPRLTSTSPANGTRGVNPNTQILLVFSEQLGSSASSVANYRLTTSGGLINPSSASVSGSSVVLSFSRPLLVDTTYTLFLESGIRDRANNSLEPTNPITFSTLNIPGQPGDTTAPQVTSHNPGPNATNVGTRTEFIITFSEAMKSSTLLNTNNYVLTSASGQVQLTATVLSGTAVRLGLRTPPLLGGVAYQLLLTSALTDLQNNPLSPFTINFTTTNVPGEQGSDVTAPTLLSSNPASGSTTVDRNAQILLVFSEQMRDASSVSKYTLTSSGAPSFNPTTATVSGASVVLSFRQGLSVDTEYTLALNSLTDLANNPLQPTAPINFRTANVPGLPGDKTSPSVTNTSPRNGETVGVDTEIFVTFSEGMLSSTLSSVSNYRLTTAGGPYPFTVSVINQTAVRLVPTRRPLLGNTGFTLFLTSGLTDLQGNPLIPVTVGFRTANVTGVPGADITPPTLLGSNPRNGEQNVSPFTSIVLLFSEPLGPSGASASSYALTTLGAPDPVSLTVTAIQSFVSLQPQRTLLGGTTYQLSVSSNIQDSAGNTLIPTSPIFFRTASVAGMPGDTQPPQVISVNPAANTTASTSSDIFISFSEEMNISTLTSAANYSLTTQGGSFPISSITTLSASAVRLRPGTSSSRASLLPGLRYTLVLANSIRDKQGNALVSFSTTFSTFADTGGTSGDFTPPALISSNPRDGSTNIDPSTRIVLTFSEDVTATSRANFTITSASGSFNPASDAARVASPPNSFEIDPGGLSGNTVYTVVLSNRITDRAGNALVPVAFQFTTANVIGGGSDNTPPFVTQINPPNNSRAAGLDTKILVVFSESVDITPTSGPANTRATGLNSALNPANYDFFSSNGDVGVTSVSALSFPANSVELTVPTPLRGGTLYQLVPSNRILDSAGNSLVSSVFTFTTVDQPGQGVGDVTAPQVVSTNPQNNSSIVNQNTSVVLTFSEALSAAAAGQTSSPLNPSNYFVATYFDSTDPSSIDRAITVNSVEKLTVPQNTYRLTLDGSATTLPDPNRIYVVDVSNRILDLAGNQLVPFRLQFILGAPPAKPRVVATSVDTSPVATNLNSIQISFSEAVEENDGDSNLKEHFIVIGSGTNTAGVITENLDFDLIPSTGSSTNFTMNLKTASFNNATVRLVKSANYTLVISGLRSVDPSSGRSMDSFTKNFTAASN